MHENLPWKRPILVNWKNNVLFSNNAGLHSARIIQEKILGLGWSVLTHQQTLHQVISIFLVLYKMLWMTKEKKLGRSDENVSEKLVELETSLILLKRNQQVSW